MKQLKYLFVLILALTINISCSSDDDGGSSVNESSLVGTWESTVTDEDGEIKVAVTFNSNFSGILKFTYNYEGETFIETDSMTWSTNGNKLTIVSDGETEVLTYSISGNQLTTTDETGIVIVFTKQ